MASVKVAVRVRPFNKREIQRDSSCIISTVSNQIHLDPVEAEKGEKGRAAGHKFTFDFSYWSHRPSDPHFVNQERVYHDLGTDVVENAFSGYNACVFAYGQTGSGKTYTMMGTEEERGLIPRICKALFEKIKAGQDEGTTFRTQVSYLEIYNERVKDLLQKEASHSLKVREHPTSGPYVQNLSKHLVMNYSDILNLMEQGNNVRTTAQTNMNDTSSRSHAIFTITFVNAGFLHGVPYETVSKIHLVDLAGSERADATGATGQRLKEGAHINKSLVTLGSVISALAESATAKSAQKHFIPYRDSVLTWLLKDSLGGNSKTIMIATISPADINYSETLSTLRYANRAKNIINKPTINEDANVKLIRDLREEIDRLKNMMSLDPMTLSLVQKELAVKEAQERHLTEEWTEKWKEAANILQEQRALALKRTGLGVMLDSDQPHLVGIDEDVLSTGITLYHLKEGSTSIGTEDSEPDIALKGACIEIEHCLIKIENGVATLHPLNNALCMVNASLVTEPTKLSQGCVVVLGKTNMFRYNDPLEAASMRRNKVEHMRSPPLMNQSLLSQSLSDLRNTHNGVRSKNSPDGKLHSSEGNIKETDESPIGNSPPSMEESNDDSTVMNSSMEASSISINSGNNNSYLDSSDVTNNPSPMTESKHDHSEEMNELYKSICDQKEVIMSCLESEQCDIKSLNEELSHLKEMQENFSRLELENVKSIWCSTLPTNTSLSDDQMKSFDEKFSSLVEQEVDRRLFQEKVLKAESDFHEKEMLRIQSDRDLIEVKRQHEREIYLLRKKLHEAKLNGMTPITTEPAVPHINVMIPRHVIKNGSHVEYEVTIVTKDSNWSIFRRFRMFRDLHQNLSAKYGPIVASIAFPSRKLFGNTSEGLALERRQQLQKFLHELISRCSTLPNCPLFRSSVQRDLTEFSSFFEPDNQ